MEEEKNSILKQIYNGELYPKEEIPKTKEFLMLARKKIKIENELLKIINQEQSKLFHNYMEIQSHLSSLDCENQFLLGFKTAIKILIEGLSQEENKK